MNGLVDKRVLITGVCGTVGAELLQQLLDRPAYSPAEVIGIDNRESDLFFIDQKYLEDRRAQFFVADIRDRDELCRKMQGIDIVFHAAALKHVVLCERSPFEAVQSNIIGVQNIIHAANECNVEKVIFTSSDKAVNPTNVMGTSKLMGERLMTAANSSHRDSETIFSSTRFGNILGSYGSVIPIFRKQIESGGPVTLTHPDMTRFIMSIEEAVRLVIDTVEYARGGEVFVTKMPVARIQDLATILIQELAPDYGFDPGEIEIQEIGIKPGEKLYEELMSNEETRRSVELTNYFSILPAFRGLYKNIEYDYDDIISSSTVNSYVSSKEMALSQSDLRRFLINHCLLSSSDAIIDRPATRYWPGDKEDR